jgi:murein DD-endopeptidase MepM/ murein hydrolase activator NlpD
MVRSSPVPVGSKITSPWGRRTDPITGQPAGHDGVDWGVPTGTPIKSVADGIVYRLDIADDGIWDGNGAAVWLDDGTYKWGFLHLYTLDPALANAPKRGRSGGAPVHVVRGQLLGLSGSTGRATGPHLHLGCFRYDGTSVDPIPLLDGDAVVPYSGPRVLHMGMKGSDVVQLQQRLGLPADGDFGPKTDAEVRVLQRTHGLRVDGEVGPATRAAMGWV